MKVSKILVAIFVFALAAIALPGSHAEAAYGPAETWAVAPQTSMQQIDAMVELNDGRVLLRHNQDSHTLPVTYLYNPGNNTRSTVTPGLYAGQGSRLTALSDGRVLLSGLDGNSPQLGTGLALFNPSTDLFTSVASLLTPRVYHTATALSDGRVLIAGGMQTSLLASAETYDPATNTRTPVASMTHPRMVHAAVLLDDGRVLVAGGNTVWPGVPVYNPITAAEIYDPATDTWSPAGATPPHLTSALAKLNDGRVLMGGGFDGDPFNPQTLTDAVIYDPATNSWSPAAPMLHRSDGQQHVKLTDGRVLVTGRGSDARAQIYDPATNSWSRADEVIEREPASYSTAIALTSSEVLLTLFKISGPGTTNIQIWDADGDLDGFNDRRESQLAENGSAFCAIMRADLNTDGTVNSGDQLRLGQYYFESPVLPRMDLNGDGNVNSGDKLRLALEFGKSVLTCP